jgi:hypothetical protein
VWALLAGVSLMACSSTNANDTPKTDDGGFDTSVMGSDAGASDAPQPVVTQTVGAAGGTVQTPGAVLTIPAGALSSNVVISVTPDAASVPPEFTAFSPVYRFEPSGTTFLTPVTITLTLTTPAANATVFELNAAGGYDGLVTTTNDTTASAATLRNPQVTYQLQIMYTTVQADTGTGTFWRVLLGLTSATTQTCYSSPQPTYPEITYTHYTANVLDATFTSKHLGATCSVTATATATATGQHSTGSFTATLDSQSDAGTQSHAFTSGSYDEIF